MPAGYERIGRYCPFFFCLPIDPRHRTVDRGCFPPFFGPVSEDTVAPDEDDYRHLRTVFWLIP